MGVLAVGGVVAEVRTGQDIAKKRAAYLERGGQHLGQYSIRDGHGKMQQVLCA